jgi:hypothetical protein
MARVLQCPYCDNFLARPVDIKFRDMEFTGGICRCGTVYLFDRSGRNLGEIYLDALTFLCRGDIERALSLGHEEYEDVDFEYDYQTNRIDARSKSGKSGRVIFMRLRERADDQTISKES